MILPPWHLKTARYSLLTIRFLQMGTPFAKLLRTLLRAISASSALIQQAQRYLKRNICQICRTIPSGLTRFFSSSAMASISPVSPLRNARRIKRRRRSSIPFHYFHSIPIHHFPSIPFHSIPFPSFHVSFHPLRCFHPSFKAILDFGFVHRPLLIHQTWVCSNIYP